MLITNKTVKVLDIFQRLFKNCARCLGAEMHKVLGFWLRLNFPILKRAGKARIDFTLLLNMWIDKIV